MSKTITKHPGLIPWIFFGDSMNDDYVRVKDYILIYMWNYVMRQKRNFTHTKVYDFDEAYLRRGTTLKLKKVQEELKRIRL